MKSATVFCLCAVFAHAVLIASPLRAQQRRDRDVALAAIRSGQILPLRQIEGKILPQMSGCRYLGPELHDNTIYRLKFIRNNTVIWIDVDGQSGDVISRTDATGNFSESSSETELISGTRE
ncbi:MAG: hypothetical protein ABF461_03750 [Zymomonas mobilis subsp. pomaceae]|uniref:PepSY domain-containing protein n=1 Tax=Zymomonas mobilis subsp. pomaceae (strain ATCC 29192 / DSM 22645 / JCM 10191 / CCUG 17912 / NBRC 13757 / NCIMB 11200 / NRRL B-4491 / Barker I) TaxID=579138 RepID=F8ETS9_ZYMMT|nr:hypothetical protein [Zymomonas mobilis]AEI38026.1 hypothetical protein Zymop_1131 [Zymomonas mobilis subsp. pomaceae ATCC 29192]MDX5949393.1 hypothetical protein [Zymomonas mobilis subsp. pomaceae]GEB89136.1 hypothetical protein ZMO02_07730 [Zymomonas mobilis subsp. pomaceae]